MKTAIQEMIEHIQINATKFSMMNTYNMLKVIEPYLEKEKEQIVDAYRIASINNAPNKDISKYTSEYWQVNAELWYDKYFKKN